MDYTLVSTQYVCIYRGSKLYEYKYMTRKADIYTVVARHEKEALRFLHFDRRQK